MTNDELEAVRARASKATDGPWYRSGIRGRMGDLECFRVFDGNEQWFASVFADTANGPMHARSLADAEFIAHARTDIPALITALERAEAHAAALAGAITRSLPMLYGPHEWGYRDPVVGGFVEDRTPFNAAARLEQALSAYRGEKDEACSRPSDALDAPVQPTSSHLENGADQ